MKHAFEILKEVQKDGQFEAVVVLIESTGDSGQVAKERRRHVIPHGLGRIPVGCEIILKDATCDIYVVSSDENDITVKFTADRVRVHVRIY